MTISEIAKWSRDHKPRPFWGSNFVFGLRPLFSDCRLLYAASAWCTRGLQQLLTVSASRHLSNEASALDCVHGADVSSLAELVDSADDALGLYQGILYVQSQPRFTLTVTRSQRNRTLSQTSFYLQRLDVCRLITF